jgi:hypothetical protein
MTEKPDPSYQPDLRKRGLNYRLVEWRGVISVTLGVVSGVGALILGHFRLAFVMFGLTAFIAWQMRGLLERYSSDDDKK